MRVWIKNIKGQYFLLQVAPDQNINDLNKKAINKIDVTNNQKLTIFYGSQPISFHQNLSTLHLQQDSVLTIFGFPNPYVKLPKQKVIYPENNNTQRIIEQIAKQFNQSVNQVSSVFDAFEGDEEEIRQYFQGRSQQDNEQNIKFNRVQSDFKVPDVQRMIEEQSQRQQSSGSTRKKYSVDLEQNIFSKVKPTKQYSSEQFKSDQENLTIVGFEKSQTQQILKQESGNIQPIINRLKLPEQRKGFDQQIPINRISVKNQFKR